MELRHWPQTDAMELTSLCNAVDFGLGLGGTYNLSDNAFVQTRYTTGLTKTFKGDNDGKNGNIQLAFGMKYWLFLPQRT